MTDPAGTPDYEIGIDRIRCTGTGECTIHAPDTFDVGDDAIVFVLDPLGDDLEAIRRAVVACPTRAISLQEGRNA